MAAPLAGIRVIDLTNVLAGPFCTYQLALMGAEVIKVEPPGTGDLARQLGADPAQSKSLMGVSFLAQNAGKKSVTINLKSYGGREAFLQLARTADVIVENFRPGVMDRLDLGYMVLAELNPGIVYCALTGFGQDGPLRDAPAYDQIIQGMSGAMSVTGSADSAPQRVGYPVCDSVGGLTAAMAIAGALVGRSRSGNGTFLDVSMLDATITTMGWVVSNYLVAGQVPVPMGNDNFTAAPSGTFKTADGLLNIAANKQEQFEALAEAIGRPALATDPRFAERENRKKNRAALTAEIEDRLKLHPATHWEAILNQAGIPAGRVLEVPEVLAHPQVRHRELLREISGVSGPRDRITVLGPGYRNSTSEAVISRPPPALGEHTDEVLKSLGYSAADIQELRERKEI